VKGEDFLEERKAGKGSPLVLGKGEKLNEAEKSRIAKGKGRQGRRLRRPPRSTPKR